MRWKDSMKITRKSQYSGIVRTRNLPVTNEQIQSWEGGALIQNAMPQLNQEQREWLISGMTEDEWNELFGEEE